MKKYTLKNEWDGSFYLEGTLEEIKFYFSDDQEVQEAEDMDDILHEINDSEKGNGTEYYLVK